MKTLLQLGVAALIVSTTALAQDAAKLGVISSRSGPFALSGTQAEKGTILAAEHINANGGILGKRLELTTTDSRSRAEDSSRLFRELASAGSTAILVNVNSSEALAASALSRELKVPTFSVGAYTNVLTEDQGHRYFFRLSASSRVFYAPIQQILVNKAYKRYCTISLDFVYGREQNMEILKNLKLAKPDVEVIPGCQFWLPLGTTEFTSYITAILAQRPDAVLFGGIVGQSLAPFVTQGNGFGFFKQVAGVHPTLGGPSNSEGLRRQDIPPNVLTASDFLYPPVDRPELKAFMEAYRKRWNELPTEFSANAYTTIKALAAALQKAGKVDREELVNAMEDLTIDHPAQGPITVRALDHQATNRLWVGELGWDATHNRPGIPKAQIVNSEPYLLNKEQVDLLRASATRK